MNDTKETSGMYVANDIPGFERAGGRLLVRVYDVKNPTATLDAETMKRLAKTTMDELEAKLEEQDGIPFKVHVGSSNGIYRIDGYIEYDEKTPLGRLLSDPLISFLIKEGCFTWVSCRYGAVKMTDKMSGDRLRKYKIKPRQIYGHKYHKRILTQAGKPVTEKNLSTTLSRNNHK